MIRLSAILFLAVAACTSVPATHDLEIRGASIAHGDDLHVGLVQTPAVVLINDESFPFHQPGTGTYGDILDAGGRYALHLYYDGDNDGACSALLDRVWQLELAEVETNAIVDLDTIAQDPTGCAYFER